jgi:transposase
MSNGKRRAFDGKFKERAVALATDRKNVAQAARELEISASLLRSWITASVNAEVRGKGLAGALEDQREMERLRKLVAEQAEELTIIKKATAYFAREQLGRNTPGSKK